MKRLLLLTTLCFALLAAIPAMSLGGADFGTDAVCAASFGVEDASACGGQRLTNWVPISSSPPGGQYMNSYFGYCYPYQLGWIAYATEDDNVLYTVECQYV